MKIDFNAILITIDGKEMNLDAEGKQKASLATVCKNALISGNERNLTGKEKLERWELAKKLDGIVDLKVEEVAKIKEVVGDMYAASVVGPAYELLEKTT